ncbi:MAG TPA: radical SAM protein [Desulfobulbus sp.]|nr:radical SAM protein [Desulfobulbus sp.]
MIDIILITQSDSVDYKQYSRLPLERIELYRDLVFPRMVHFKNAFHSHLDLINHFKSGIFFNQAEYPQRRNLLNIWNLPGLSGIHLANYLSNYGIKAAVINNIDSEWDIFCALYEKNTTPPLVGISTTFYLSYTEIRRLSQKLHNFAPEMEIVLGGAFVNEQAMNNGIGKFENSMRKNKISYVLHAFNSEKDLKDLLLGRASGNLDQVNNLAYLEGKDFADCSFKATAMQWHPPVLETPPFWDKIETPFVNRTIPMRTSSGCPFCCAFCSYPKVAKGFHTMSCEELEKNIQAVLRGSNVNKIIFIDDTINVPVPRFKELCKMFAKYDFDWFSFLRVQFVDQEIAQLMKESGCKAVYLGIESASDTVLKNMNKKATVSQYRRGIELLSRNGIKSMAAFIIGFPGETEATVQENVEFIETTGLDFYTLKEFYYMSHTPIHQRREEYGLSGMGNKWRHDTMDSNTAYQFKIEMFKGIKNSVFIDPDTSLWYLAYLYDQGFSINAITEIQTAINDITIDQIDGVYRDDTPSFKRLAKLLQ